MAERLQPHGTERGFLMEKNQMGKEEKNRKWVPWVALFCLITLGIEIRIVSLPFISPDMEIFLLPWYEKITATGFHALAGEIGNYTPIYYFLLYLVSLLPLAPVMAIKLISILFDAGGAILIGFIVYKLFANKNYAYTASLIAWFLPTVFVNSALWGQADSIYTFFILLFVLYALEEKYVPAMLFYGIAFGFKLQTIFLLPAVILLWFWKERVKLWHYALFFAGCFITFVPSLIAGRTILSCLNPYMKQINDTNALNMNMPNVFSIIGDSSTIQQCAPILSNIGILLAIAAEGVVLLKGIYCADQSMEKWIRLSVLSVLVANFFLPHMHERYTYVAVLLGIVMFFESRVEKACFLTIVAHASIATGSVIFKRFLSPFSLWGWILLAVIGVMLWRVSRQD